MGQTKQQKAFKREMGSLPEGFDYPCGCRVTRTAYSGFVITHFCGKHYPFKKEG